MDIDTIEKGTLDMSIISTLCRNLSTPVGGSQKDKIPPQRDSTPTCGFVFLGGEAHPVPAGTNGGDQRPLVADGDRASELVFFARSGQQKSRGEALRILAFSRYSILSKSFFYFVNYVVSPKNKTIDKILMPECSCFRVSPPKDFGVII